MLMFTNFSASLNPKQTGRNAMGNRGKNKTKGRESWGKQTV